MSRLRREVKYWEVIKDLEAGLSDEALKRKYRLTDRGLNSLFRKLRGIRVDGLPANSVVLRTPSIALGLNELAAALRQARRVHVDPSAPEESSSARRGWTCPACLERFHERFDKCPACGVRITRLLDVPEPGQRGGEADKTGSRARPISSTQLWLARSGDETSRVLGILAAILMLIGVFAPVVSVPLLGGLNHFQIDRLAKGVAVCGYLLVAIAIASIVLVILGKHVWLWLSGLGSLLAIGYTYIRYRGVARDLAVRIQGLATRLDGSLGQSQGGTYGPGPGHTLSERMATGASDLIRLDWGLILLIIAALLLLASASVHTMELVYRSSSGNRRE